jgi:hypothetical protein
VAPASFGDLQAIAAELRKAYRAWADGLARDFAAICRDKFQHVLPDAFVTEMLAAYLLDVTETVAYLRAAPPSRRADASP